MDALTWIEISASRLVANYRLFRGLAAEGSTVMPVVKANAYGHGLREAATILAREGCRNFAVHSAAEAETLASLEAARNSALLLLSAVPQDKIGPLAAAGARFTVFDLDQMREINEAGRRSGARIPVHIKVETGVQRQGFAPEQLPELSALIADSPYLQIEGLSTHFANIEDTTDHSYAQRQMKRFDEISLALAVLGVKPPLKHSACSAAAILFPETHGKLIRLGISLYGHWSSRETLVSARSEGRNSLNLQPVLTWKARIIQVKNLAAGSYVGYGCSWKAETDTRLAVLPVGYSDGYDRGLEGAWALLRGRRVPVRGRVMMNLMLVDVTHIPNVRRGEEVVLLGKQGDEEISAETLASQAGTINYEILSRIAPHLERRVAD